MATPHINQVIQSSIALGNQLRQQAVDWLLANPTATLDQALDRFTGTIHGGTTVSLRRLQQDYPSDIQQLTLSPEMIRQRANKVSTIEANKQRQNSKRRARGSSLETRSAAQKAVAANTSLLQNTRDTLG